MSRRQRFLKVSYGICAHRDLYVLLIAASLTMYQRARKLGALIGDVSDFVSLTELQLEAYVVGMNALALIDQKNAWIVLPVTGETEHEVSRRPFFHAGLLTVGRSCGSRASDEDCRGTYQRAGTL